MHAAFRRPTLRFPVILASDGSLMGGGHRISKAWLAERSTVQAVKLVVDPSACDATTRGLAQRLPEVLRTSEGPLPRGEPTAVDRESTLQA